jgi:putative tricarboxylic transport membrane protein
MTTPSVRSVVLKCLPALGGFLTIGGLFAPAAVRAETDYPAGHPIAIIVPFAAGSGSDLVARALADSMAKDLGGASIVVDNKPGADGMIGAVAAAKSSPDGHTLFLSTNTVFSVNPYIHKTLPYDPNVDFTPIGLVGETAPALLTAVSNPASSVKDVIDAIRTKPSVLNFAKTNTSSEAATRLLETRNQLKLVLVNYKAAPQALTDTMAGTINYFFGDLASGGALVRGGQLKALAVLSDKRLPGFPDVPTVAEAGYPGLEIPIWIGLFGPKGMPAALTERINQSLVAAQRQPALVQSLENGAINVRAMLPVQFDAYVKDQFQVWGRLAKEIGLQQE